MISESRKAVTPAELCQRMSDDLVCLLDRARGLPSELKEAIIDLSATWSGAGAAFKRAEETNSIDLASTARLFHVTAAVVEMLSHLELWVRDRAVLGVGG